MPNGKNSTHAKAGGNPDEINIIAPFNGSPIRLADVTVYPEHENQEYQFRIVNNATQDEQILIVEAVVGGGFMIVGEPRHFSGNMKMVHTGSFHLISARTRISGLCRLKGQESGKRPIKI